MPIGKVIRPRQETFLTPYGDSNLTQRASVDTA